MTLTTAGKDWLAINAGVNNCFSPSGVSFVDADGAPFTAGTKDVVITFIGANMVGKGNAIIIANTSYNGFKAINGNIALGYPDVTLVYNSDGHIGATLPLYCAPPAQIISATLTVDTNDCVTPCTVNGTVSWTNNGGSPGIFDPAILVNTVPTSLGTAVTIGIGETKSYTFSLPGLTAGIYTVHASPNTGTAPQTITVRTPANIVSTSISAIPRVLPCVQSCTVDVTVIWTNNGGSAGSFIPSINVDGTPISPPQYTSEPLAPGASIEHTFVTDVLAVGSHQICADPNGTCATINIYSGPSIAATGITTDKTSCTSPCDVTIDVTWTNTGDVDGTFTPSINIDSLHIPLSPETLTAGTSVMHTFGPITLTAGTYNICADPDSGTCVTVNVLTPANVISATLTVDTNDCITPCTVNGTVSWTNTGGTASAPTDLAITFNGGSTTVASAVVIGPGETTAVYPFTIYNLVVGTYTVQASPNTGTAPQTITVRTPANIIATAITPSMTTCTAPCNVTVDIIWTNNGGVPGTFVPTITVDGTPTTLSTESLNSGQSVTKTFSLTGLTVGNHAICAIPNTFPCATVSVTVPLTSVHITSTPSIATIYIDGSTTPSGITPATITGLYEGLHTYRLTREGCDNEATGQFTTVVGITAELPVIFDTSARFTSAPSGARIWIDDANTGINTPGTVTGLIPGYHTYRLTLATYTDATGHFTVDICKRKNITASISKFKEAGMGTFVILGLAVGAILMGKKKKKEPEKGHIEMR